MVANLGLHPPERQVCFESFESVFVDNLPDGELDVDAVPPRDGNEEVLAVRAHSEGIDVSQVDLKGRRRDVHVSAQHFDLLLSEHRRPHKTENLTLSSHDVMAEFKVEYGVLLDVEKAADPSLVDLFQVQILKKNKHK